MQPTSPEKRDSTTKAKDHGGHFHAVQFYSDSVSLCGIVAAFIGEGLEQGDPAIVIATPTHIEVIEQCLRMRHLDVAGLKRQGDLVTLDAKTELEMFMADGMPDAGAFSHVV